MHLSKVQLCDIGLCVFVIHVQAYLLLSFVWRHSSNYVCVFILPQSASCPWEEERERKMMAPWKELNSFVNLTLQQGPHPSNQYLFSELLIIASASKKHQKQRLRNICSSKRSKRHFWNLVWICHNISSVSKTRYQESLLWKKVNVASGCPESTSLVMSLHMYWHASTS